MNTKKNTFNSTRIAAARQFGFTLLEMLVVVLIIGLLTGIIAPRILGQLGRSEVTVARAQIDSFDKALQSFRIDTGRFPTTNEGLQALLVAPSADIRWNGPYLKGGIPLDPWGSPYQYTSPGVAPHEFDILSLGSDRASGGTGEAADLTNN